MGEPIPPDDHTPPQGRLSLYPSDEVIEPLHTTPPISTPSNGGPSPRWFDNPTPPQRGSMTEPPHRGGTPPNGGYAPPPNGGYGSTHEKTLLVGANFQKNFLTSLAGYFCLSSRCLSRWHRWQRLTRLFTSSLRSGASEIGMM